MVELRQYDVLLGSRLHPVTLQRKGERPSPAEVLRRYARVTSKLPRWFHLATLYGEGVGAAIEKRHAYVKRHLEARDGFEAIGLAEDNPPDLIILDVNMPGIDGYRVLEAIRRNSRLKHIPVFLVTGNDGLFDRLKGKMAHCEEYLTKPVDVSTVLKLVLDHTRATVA